MTKNLAIMLLCSVVFLVVSVMEEGGSLDTIASDDGSTQLAVSDEEVIEQEQPVLAAQVTAPESEGASDGLWNWFAADETTPAAEVRQARAEPARQPRPQGANNGETGALERRQQNIEE